MKPKHFVVKVTAEDIANGREGSANMCPIALAVKRSYPGSCPSIGFQSFKIQLNSDSIAPANFYGQITQRTQRFVGNFDHKGSSGVEPTIIHLVGWEV